MHTVISQKQHYLDALAKIGELSAVARLGAIRQLYRADVEWHGPHPVNALSGANTLIEQFWQPLFTAFPDLERRDDIVIANTFGGATWIGATGHYTGTFAADWLGLPASGGVVNIRYGEFSRMEAGQVGEAYVILDLLDVMRQIECWPPHLPKGRGLTDRIPGPATRNGVSLSLAPATESEKSLRLVESMIAGLMRYDQKSLDSMGMQRFWHPQMMWYGPAAIGTSRRLEGFQDVHQRAFLAAFPDRVGGNHKARIADGAYVGSCGWPSINATHLGPWLGVPATNRRITMRVMDFWRREGDFLRENWVFIDQVDLLLQMDVDAFAHLLYR
ncbi:MAG: ester cyclase [Burkholderiales bacterium]|nr:ester cyclase [Rhodocyclaceae bacterium]